MTSEDDTINKWFEIEVCLINEEDRQKKIDKIISCQRSSYDQYEGWSRYRVYRAGSE